MDQQRLDLYWMAVDNRIMSWPIRPAPIIAILIFFIFSVYSQYFRPDNSKILKIENGEHYPR